jgi:hypothetical protein
MSTLEVLARDGFQALEKKQSTYTLRRLDEMAVRLQDMDEFLTDIIDRELARSHERKASISAH